jgi:hypothetical protein
MTLNEIAMILEAEKLFSGDYNEKEIAMACASDLMSDVLAFIKKNDTLLLTSLINPQVIRTAELAEIIAVCFVRGKKPLESTVVLAKAKGIPLLITNYSMFNACGKLYEKGMRGCGRKQ